MSKDEVGNIATLRTVKVNNCIVIWAVEILNIGSLEMPLSVGVAIQTKESGGLPAVDKRRRIQLQSVVLTRHGPILISSFVCPQNKPFPSKRHRMTPQVRVKENAGIDVQRGDIVICIFDAPHQSLCFMIDRAETVIFTSKWVRLTALTNYPFAEVTPLVSGQSFSAHIVH